LIYTAFLLLYKYIVQKKKKKASHDDIFENKKGKFYNPTPNPSALAAKGRGVKRNKF